MLQVAYINHGPIEKTRKPTKKELLHAECIASLATIRAEDKKKALKKFAAELKELEDLKEELRLLEMC